MANVIDISVFDQDPTTVKITETETIVIPGEVSTRFNIKLIACNKRYFKLQEALAEIENDDDAVNLYEELINLLRDVVLLIVQQDKNKRDVGLDYVDEYFSTEKKLYKMFSIGMNHVKAIEQDPNSVSPK